MAALETAQSQSTGKFYIKVRKLQAKHPSIMEATVSKRVL